MTPFVTSAERTGRLHPLLARRWIAGAHRKQAFCLDGLSDALRHNTPPFKCHVATHFRTDSAGTRGSTRIPFITGNRFAEIGSKPKEKAS